MTSPNTMARIAGSLYLFASLAFLLAVSVRSGFTKASDAAGTADHIRSSASLYRLTLTGELVSWTLFLLMVMALYLLLSSVHRMSAAAMVVFVVVLVTVGFLNDLNQYTALTIATDAAYPKALGVDASNALVMLAVQTQNNGFLINEMFWGLWLLPLGYLVIRSRWFPRLMGILLLVAAINWIAQFFLDLLGITYPGVVAQILGAGELVFMAWLILFGVNLPAADRPGAVVATSLELQ